MASDVTMPRLSDSMEEGTVLKWLVDEGGEVKRGEPLVEIETDKANMTYDADSDGVLVEIVAQEGDTLPIGDVIARIGEAGEAESSGDEAEAGGEEAEASGEDEGGEAKEEGAEEDEAAEEAEPAKAEGDADAAAGDETEGEDEAAAAGGEEGEAAVAGAEGGAGETQAAAGTATRERPAGGNGDGRVKASPVARRMARDLGVELAQLEGTGPGGRIVKADVQAAAENGGAKAEAKAETADEGDGAATGKAETKDKPKKAEEKKEPAKEPQKGEAGAKGEAEIQELTKLQQTVSRRMAESKATAPDFSISLTVDMTKAVELRK